MLWLFGLEGLGWLVLFAFLFCEFVLVVLFVLFCFGWVGWLFGFGVGWVWGLCVLWFGCDFVYGV